MYIFMYLVSLWLISLDLTDYRVIIFRIMNAVPTSCSLALLVLIYVRIWTKQTLLSGLHFCTSIMFWVFERGFKCF